MLFRILTILVIFALTVVPASAEDNPFTGLLETATSYFTPVIGNVTSFDGSMVLSGIDSSSGVIPGARLRILRKGKSFVHPITKEPLGRAETQIGLAEVVDITAEGSRLRVLSGDPQEGDLLRRSSAPIQVLFYQSSNVDWDVSEEYYFQLKSLERFEVLDAAPGTVTDEEVAAEAKRRGAEFAIVLSADYPPGKIRLTQRLLWADDASMMSSEELVLEGESVEDYKIGDELFAPKKNVPLLTFKIPYSSNLLSVGDFNGDGEKELAISSGNDIKFYTIGLSLKPALEGVEIKNPITDEHVWFEAYDLDGDGKDEVILSSLNTFSAVSRIYSFSEGKFTEIMEKDNLFLKVLNGTLYGQEYSRIRGYRGKVFRVSIGGVQVQDSTLTLPENMNLYDFNLFPTADDPGSVLAYDDRGYVLFFGGGGNLIWRSSDSLSLPTRKYESEKITEMAPTKKWSVKDRIIVHGDTALAIMRKPTAKISGTELWYKGSQILKLYQKGDSIGISVLLGDIPGKVLDYAVSDDKIFILTASKFSFAPGNIIRGRSLFATKLYIYSIRGS